MDKRYCGWGDFCSVHQKAGGVGHSDTSQALTAQSKTNDEKEAEKPLNCCYGAAKERSRKE